MKRIVLYGKAWEICARLKWLSQKYTYVSEWISDFNKPVPFQKRNSNRA